MQLFANNAKATLLSAISANALSLQVASGAGAQFPNPANGDYFLVTLGKVVSGIETEIEIVKCTARAGDVLTVQRGIEGTVAVTHAVGDFVSLRMTAGSFLDQNINSLVVKTSVVAPNFTGLASAATILATPRSIALAGDVQGVVNFDGSQNVVINASFPSVVVANTYRSVQVNAKGIVVGGSNPTTLAGYGITDSPQPAAVAPIMNGAAAIGASVSYARADHVHASDTSRAPLNGVGTSGTWPISVTGSSAAITGVNPIANGGTGQSTAANALTALGGYPLTNPNNYIAASGAPVQSVGGLTGAITKVQLGIDQVSNTSDASKPVSTAQAAANAATLNAAKIYADGLVVGLWDDRGNHDASGNLFPTLNGSGAGGAILKGDVWTISVAGILSGVPVAVRQTVRAMIDAPGQITANWAIGLANTDIDNSISAGITGRAPSQDAVATALAAKAGLTGTGTSGNWPIGTTGSVRFVDAANQNATFVIPFGTGINAQTALQADTELTYNPATNTLTVPTLNAGNLTTTSSVARIGGVAPAYWMTQDGAGRQHWYWNTTGGTAPLFAVGGEDANDVMMGAINAGGGGCFVYRTASGVGKNAGDAIVWQTILYADAGSFTYKGNTLHHSGNLTNLSQLANGPGYISAVPMASQTVLGGVRVGANLSIDAAGVLSASNAGAVVLLGAAVISAPVVNIDFLNIFTAAYSRYEIELDGVKFSASDLVALRLANGGSVDATTNYSGHMSDNSQTTTRNQFFATNHLMGDRGCSCSISLRGTSDATSIKSITSNANFVPDGTPRYANFKQNAIYAGGAVSGFRLFGLSGGNFTGGTIRIYGYKN